MPQLTGLRMPGDPHPVRLMRRRDATCDVARRRRVGQHFQRAILPVSALHQMHGTRRARAMDGQGAGRLGLR